MAALLEAWLRFGLSAEAFLDATPRLFLMVTDAAVDRCRRDDEGRLHAAWTGAVLSRASKIPKFESLISHDEPDADPEMRAAEQRAELAAMRMVMAERGQGRSWKEWQGRSRS